MDILDMARIDAAAIIVERQWVTAAEVIDAAMMQVRHALEGRTVKVHADSDRLAMTRGLLAAARGRVWAENIPGAGATFSIVVPGAVRAPVEQGQEIEG